MIPSTPPRTPSPDNYHCPLPTPRRRAQPPAAISLPPPHTSFPSSSSPHNKPSPSPKRSILVKRSSSSLKPPSPGTFPVTPPHSPNSLPVISRKSSSRSLSLAHPYRSPPPSPTIASPPPPVPPIPSFMLDSASPKSRARMLEPVSSRDDVISPISLVPRSSFAPSSSHPGRPTTVMQMLHSKNASRTTSSSSGAAMVA